MIAPRLENKALSAARLRLRLRVDRFIPRNELLEMLICQQFIIETLIGNNSSWTQGIYRKLRHLREI